MRISDWSSDVCSSDLSIHGFAVLYATDVRPPLLYGPNMSPLRVTGTIGTESDIEGPYLALVAFEGEPDGRAAAIEAYAAPIFHARRFILVRSELDRDVLRALEHLQAALDDHGVERSEEHTSELQSLM